MATSNKSTGKQSNESESDDLPAQPTVPYRRERTPSIIVQTFNRDLNITKSIELLDNESETDEEARNSNTPSELTDFNKSDSASPLDAQTNQASCDNLTSANSTKGSVSSLHISPASNSPIRNIRNSILFQTPRDLPASGPTNRRLSLNIVRTAPRRQSLTVEGLTSTFKDLPVTSESGNATGSLRNKTALKPGHSLMGWICYANTAKNLSGTGGKKLDVSLEELAKHDTEKDCWLALKGNVYNVTEYLQYHPGGVEELMNGAGQDATELFNEMHRWVNFESILEKCYVGRLKTQFGDT